MDASWLDKFVQQKLPDAIVGQSLALQAFSTSIMVGSDFQAAVALIEQHQAGLQKAVTLLEQYRPWMLHTAALVEQQRRMIDTVFGARLPDWLTSAHRAARLLTAVNFNQLISTPNLDLLLAADESQAPEEQWLASERLAARRFLHPIPFRRWVMYKQQIRQACEELATVDEASGQFEYWTVVFRRTVTRAIIVALHKAKQPHPYVFLTIDGLRRKVGPVVPWDELPSVYFDKWFANRVADEVMDDLLPEWRDDEKQARVEVRTVSLEELLISNAEDLHPMLAQDMTIDAGLELVEAQATVQAATSRLAQLLACASPRQHEIWHMKSLGWTEEAIAEELGIDRGAVAAQWSRLRKKALALAP